MLLPALLSWRSPAGPRARLTTLIFHRVLARPDELFPEEVDAARFEAVCTWVREWFNVLPLDEAARRLREGGLPARAMAITFDDGYADNLEIAAPILQRHGLACTFFIATGYLDGGRMWNDTIIEALRACRHRSLDLRSLHPTLGDYALGDTASRRRAIDHIIGQVKYLPAEQRQRLVDEIGRRSGAPLPTDLMMRSDQVRQLRTLGMHIGAHTVSHPILCRLPRDDARREIVDGKQQLEHLLGEPVGLFAYPNGKPGEDYSPEDVELVREAGFDAAVSTAWGSSDAQTDRFQLRRFTPWDRSRTRFGLRLLRNLGS